AEQPVEADRPDRAQHRGGMAVRQRAADADPLRGDGDASLQQRAKTFEQRGGPIRQVGQSALPNPAIVTKALAQQDRGGQASMGHRSERHGASFSITRIYQPAKST